MEDAVLLFGLSSCFAAVAVTADSSAVMAAVTAAATTAACGSSYCSSAAADGAAMAAAIPSANTIRKNSKKPGPAAAGPGFLFISEKVLRLPAQRSAAISQAALCLLPLFSMALLLLLPAYAVFIYLIYTIAIYN